MEEFKTLANSYGIEFSSDDEAKDLFWRLTEGTKTLTKMVLSEAEMAGISGGGFYSDAKEFSRVFLRWLKPALVSSAVGGLLGLVYSAGDIWSKTLPVSLVIRYVADFGALGASTAFLTSFVGNTSVGMADMVRDARGTAADMSEGAKLDGLN